MKRGRRKTGIFGAGINDAGYPVMKIINGKQVMCVFYNAWKTMIMRCYSLKWQSKYPTYKDCTMDKEWLLFSVFKKWMENQDWKGNQLDKDILIPGNKHYGVKSCVFVDRDTNVYFRDFTSR